MFRKRIFSLLMAVLCLWGIAGTAFAAEVDCDSVYCFNTGDFSEEELSGIFLTDLPEASVGTVLLGSRILQEGDILTAGQLAQMTFCPGRTEQDSSAEVGYLPIFENRVEPSAAMVIAIRGKEDKPPVAEDSAGETYKNLPNTGKLKVEDPEGQPLTFTVIRQPKRGTVTLSPDGSFTYTPKKNKVGIDSFTYTAADPAGKVSREATVTITILKPTDATQYTDTLGKSCRFAAEWMKNTGIFVGENLVGNACFHPEKSVTRGEFLTMLVKTLEIPEEGELAVSGFADEIPQWLQPYLTAAIRSGLTAGLPEQQTFGADVVITGAEAAVMLHNALDLPVQQQPADGEEESLVPVWAEPALTAMESSGIALDANAPLTRGQAAEILYRAKEIASVEENRFETEA